MSAPLPSIDRYAVEAEIGGGGFGAVYRARHLVLGRKVALKVLHAQRATDADVMQRFLREARAVAGLGSPYIVQVLDADMTSDGRAFIAMELLDGEDLAQRLSKVGRLPTHTVIRIGRDILAALVVAHAQGVVHRDLKPGNVFLAKDARGEESAKVLDFGISKVRTEAPADELTRTGTMLGTPYYMAPEQLRSSRDVDGRADLYSLGVLLYEALAGKLPYKGDTLHQLIAAKLTEVPPPLAQVAPHVPHSVAKVVMRALETEPENRYASAAEMDAALAAVEMTVSAPGIAMTGRSSGRPAPMPSAPPSSIAPAPRGMPRWVSWVLGIGAVLAMGALVLLVITLLGAYVAQRELRSWLNEGDAPVAAPVAAPVPASPTPAPPASPATTPADVSGVQLTARVLGVAPATAVDGVVERARPTLAACRGTAPFREEIHMTILAGGALHGPTESIAGPPHLCVLDAIVAAGPASSALPGVAIFTVSLDAL